MHRAAQCTGLRTWPLHPLLPSRPHSTLLWPWRWPPCHITDHRKGFVRLMLTCRIESGDQCFPIPYRAKSQLFSHHPRPAVIPASVQLADPFSSPRVLTLSIGLNVPQMYIIHSSFYSRYLKFSSLPLPLLHFLCPSQTFRPFMKLSRAS